MDKKKSCLVHRLCREELLLLQLRSVLGLLIFTIGVLCVVYDLPRKFVESKVRSSLSLSPGSPMYSEWINPPLPVYMKFHIFNVTNPREIVKGGKPIVEECGPYTYLMSVPKFNVTFHPNSTVSFFNNHTLTFQPEMSLGNEDDVLCHLNVALVSLSAITKDMPYIFDYFGLLGKAVDMYGGGDLFLKHTAYEILFGYQDPIFTMLSNVGPFIGRKIDPVFGFFYKFNNSDDGSFLVYTGQSDYRRTHVISKWNGERYLSLWSTKYANMINGTDGSFLGPNLSSKDTPYIYFPQMCRSMKVEYEGDSEFEGIPTLKYHLSNDFLLNSTVKEDNIGFCVPPGNCYDSGVLNIQSCMEGAPGFISLPHFYNAARKYQMAVSGLSPDKEKHDSVYHVEPKTGAVLRSYRRLQINILMQPSNRFESTKNIQETIFPILWLEGSADADDNIASNLRMVAGLMKVADAFSYVLICLGCLLLISVAFRALKTHCFTKLNGYLPDFLRKSDGKGEKPQKETSL